LAWKHNRHSAFYLSPTVGHELSRPSRNAWSRAVRNMSASHSSPTIALNLRGVPLPAVTDSLAPLPAKLSLFNSHMRQSAYYRNFKCIFEDLWPCYCYVTKANNRTNRSPVSQPASAGKEADSVNCKLITVVTKTVNLTLVQCECHIGKQTVIARINLTNQN